jgi:hypothetical protein
MGIRPFILDSHRPFICSVVLHLCWIKIIYFLCLLKMRVAVPGNLSWLPPASEVKVAEVGGCGGGGDAPDATDPLDDDGGRSEAADASLESAKVRGVKVAPITLEERSIVMEEFKGGDIKGCN